MTLLMLFEKQAVQRIVAFYDIQDDNPSQMILINDECLACLISAPNPAKPILRTF